MARLAEIRSVARTSGQPATSIYLNPVNVNFVEAITGGTRITMNNGDVLQTTEAVTEVVGVIQQAMM